jgi:uncharacterized protein (DUF169 family)
MDLLKNMMEKRQAQALIQHHPLVKYEPVEVKVGKKKSKTEKAKEHIPGTKDMRKFIQEERPANKVVREHLTAIISNLTESSDEDSE